MKSRVRHLLLAIVGVAVTAAVALLVILSQGGEASTASDTGPQGSGAAPDHRRGTVAPSLVVAQHPRDRALDVLHRKYDSIADKRRAYVAALEATGIVEADWTLPASRVVDLWRSAASDIAEAEFGELRCFAGGCLVLATYDTRQTAKRVDERVWEVHLSGEWIGGLVRTALDVNVNETPA